MGMSDTHGQTGLDTFPRLLMQHAKLRPNRPAMREKAYGIWQTYTWAQVAESVRAIACGLAELGFKRGDRLAIIGDNRPRLYWSVAACQCLGGIPVMLYQDAVAQEMAYVLQDAEIRFAVVEDQEQVDKMLEIQPEVPLLERVIYDDARGMRHYTQTLLMGLDELQEMGRIHDRNQSDFLDGEVAKGASDDISIMLYTSGTTGKPKGVCQTHGAFIAAARGGVQFDKLTDQEDILSYLPMAWVGDHLFSFAQAMLAGFTINCPESGETVMTDLREIGPTYYFAPPRVFENLLTQVMIRMEDAGAFKRKIFHHFMEVSRRCGADILDGKQVSAGDRFQYWLGNLMVYGPLKNVLGFSRIRVAYTAGAAIGPDLFRFYRSIGVNLKQLYGQTETCAYVCLQPDGEIKLDSVGKPAPFVEVKLADNGEILVKGPMLLKTYYKRPDATAESINADGYFMTGDAGFFDEDGHLKIIDRAKDVGKLNDGSMFAPNYVENKLKFFQHIKEAVTFGNGRDFVTAFINIDLEAVGNWAERKGMGYSGYTDLASQDAVYELIREGIEAVNADLAADPKMSGSQIKRFLILHKELDADDGELTRTRKVRRNFVAERYQVLVDGLYAGKKSQYIETQVKYEDGRTGKVSADLRIEEVKTFTPQAAKQAA
ncbi:MAG: long-chain fatty acid--CoA ligase [Betaproteobacteria bacterium HGW-Betaproteobacteria-13]|jgi:long-chain acyl-CoA synthetase|uniref:Long-chain fatty acid--CoA ligase n=2 Tax=Parazoarcus communis TaxID=41977 RepID=A0A2U8GY34_9RHOO|nr:long-chain fatty acid--CoA ligase [Parazoarcus communis]PKO58382.1 MAG: long-chain fatty acid--CoA ligase [Betaproteobacteria bacterium HGW-Betaproteobacteria-19]PKO80769.1 MAG: long-chain fatty acid--CoA ligase [Betaproteobacteria bacterium HGW-Betaproteobacteria-13]